MFGSEYASEILFRELTTLLPDYAGKIVGMAIAPESMTLPGCMFYPEQSMYSGPAFNRSAGDSLNYEGVRFAVRFACLGTSTNPIKAAALAQLNHLDGATFDEQYDGRWYAFSFIANGEYLPTTAIRNDVLYRQLGTVYNVEITRGE